MQPHTEYEKMPKSLKKLGADEKTLQDWHKLQWVVTEKVHGANFSFVYEAEKLHFAKRKDYLTWQDDFFAFQSVVVRLEQQILSLFEAIATRIKAEKIVIYGEIFGGSYPHKQVLAVADIQAVQTGVYYCPNIEFCGFDIAISEESGNKYYLDYQDVVSYFSEFGIFYARPLFIGKLNDVLDFDTHINSTIPAQFGLPELDKNLIEGVVIKPYRHLEQLGDAPRPVVKLKNAEFDEEEQFHQAEKWSWQPDAPSKSEELNFWVQEIRRYLTPNRLNSAISKIGALIAHDNRRKEDIKAEVLRDTLADFVEDNGNILQELPKEDYDWIIERIAAATNHLIAHTNS
jgi:Rnl2 family RNA ligase